MKNTSPGDEHTFFLAKFCQVRAFVMGKVQIVCDLTESPPRRTSCSLRAVFVAKKRACVVVGIRRNRHPNMNWIIHYNLHQL